MGYRATIVVDVDQLEEIKNDVNFGKKVASAVSSFGTRAIYSDNFVVVEKDHADISKLGIVGDGGMFSFTNIVSGDCYTKQDEFLQKLAEKLGYSITKK